MDFSHYPPSPRTPGASGSSTPNSTTSGSSFASSYSGSYTSFPTRKARAGDIGFLAKEAVIQGVDKQHHHRTHEEIGVSLINAQKKNQFVALPGITFNEKSFTSYMSTAGSARRTMQQQAAPLRGSSPRKAGQW
ncbi:hypothetical protein HYH03_007662 [Edaphochlamys debaryana]|uniref:Uncharacterized protein n=1 Tax=Edaphochlamys debaryana TaxID=47281 RepID=A0A835Y319_9CHLO|nr:hypothetical protein HYH03_007662 [Edaphochlamys debaryana]|eukprot:KAG2494309.1 hypothetical protein HYH03_007662 [Edaphochlamys debaryana]